MIEMMTSKQAEEARQYRLNEPGPELPCPFCNRPRVTRSDYIRCNQCGINWLDGEDLSRDPRLSRTKATASFQTAPSDGAPTVK